MGKSIVDGVLSSGFLKPSQISVYDPYPPALEAAAALGLASVSLTEAISSKYVILAIKPQEFPKVAAQVVGSSAVFISIMAGVSLKTLSEKLGSEKVLRVMPNLGATVGKSSTALALDGPSTNPAELDFAKGLFSTVGSVHLLPEKLFDAFTGMSGSAPAYVALFAEALADGGVRQGMPRGQALLLAAEVLQATGELLLDKHPGVLKDEVSSPGGTTIEGIAALEAGGFRNAVIKAVEASTKRSKELGAG